MDLMVSILKEGQWDCSQDNSEVYFKDLETARTKGIELLNRFNCQIFRVNRLTTGKGHYRTLGFFNKNNEYIR